MKEEWGGEMFQKNIFALKQCLEKEAEEGLLFLNAEAFYEYMKGKYCGGTTIDLLLESMKECIPMPIQENSLRRYFLMQGQEGEESLKRLWRGTKIDFLQWLHCVKEEEESLKELIQLCERKGKECRNIHIKH